MADRLDLVHFIYSHKFSTYLIFYRNWVTRIENAGNVGTKSRDPVGQWP